MACTSAWRARSWSRVPGEVPRWDRFAVEFEDGTRFALRDKRRLGRAILNPDFEHVGPDAALVGRDEFRRLIGTGRAPVKARLLDQKWISGVGNLLADESLWQARLSPRRSVATLSNEDLDRLRRSLRAAIRSAIRQGGVHSGRFIPARSREGACPRGRARTVGASHDRRPDHLLVPGLPALIWRIWSGYGA